MLLIDLEWLSEIFNDTKHRAVSLRQLSFLYVLITCGLFHTLVMSYFVWYLGEQAVTFVNGEFPNEENTDIYNEPTDLLPGSLSAEETTLYSELESDIRELPPIPVACDELGKYYYVDIDGGAKGVRSSVIYDVSEFDSGISSSVSPSSIEETPYYGLETSTREPPPASEAYETMVKPVYVNTNIAANDATSGIICDEPQNDSKIPLNVIPSSEMESIV